MRSLLRFILTFLSSVVVASFILCILLPSPAESGEDPSRGSESGNLGGWFSFRDPGSLFSPTATISLTDDNSTFFNAKPAAFGPSLPICGLSGQVWVGSGFGDDNVNRRGMAATVEGELGCADIPGWKDASRQITPNQDTDHLRISKVSSSESSRSAQTLGNLKRDDGFAREPAISDLNKDVLTDDEDGTDDHLHYPLSKTAVAKPGQRKYFPPSGGSTNQHGDIQSLQEAAEIAGKIVLLSRGGCGFAEKVKWAQRRGAVAAIIADNVRGGPLVRMYAQGDVSNITIPSLFTSHTTAHLLSHLIPPTADVETLKQANAGQSSVSALVNGGAIISEISSTAPREQLENGASSKLPESSEASDDSIRDWFSSLRMSSLDEQDKGSKWLKVEDFEEDEAWTAYIKKEPSYSTLPKTDGFVIGKQDWRDPDIVHVTNDGQQDPKSSSKLPISKPSSADMAMSSSFRGGSITPGSGEYEQPGDRLVDSKMMHTTSDETTSELKPKRRNWLSVLFGGQSKSGHKPTLKSKVMTTTPNVVKAVPQTHAFKSDKEPKLEDPDRHVGLWVTLTPTDMNASPFLNTLFVLVISPLITLAVVYSMLLLRSRIRRRRWRAPKSVVERLPVRVYTTFPSHSASGTETPVAGATSATPLLSALSRPRDAGTKAGSVEHNPVEGSSLPSSSHYGSVGQTSVDQEKVANGLAEWRRKYGGRQRECVVCLEEYIDGVSRVMSLPCGHEFHADCITPWLTTRRRTCPICKGDVVRSLHSNPTSPNRRLVPLSEEDVQQQAAERQNLSPSASIPVPGGVLTSDVDVERAEYSSSYSDISSPPTSTTWLSRSVNRGLDYLGVQQHDREADRSR